MEATGFRFLNASGEPEDCLQILKDDGVNAIRLRVWVNPSDDPQSGHCSPVETAAMALRAQKMGFRFMIDFHYSDSWADPGNQKKPAAWANDSIGQLEKDVYQHTHDMLALLKAEGVTPEWVQVGNEIPGGILFPDGDTKHWPQLAALLNEGYAAVKAVDPATAVIIHLDQGDDPWRYHYFFDNFVKNGGKWDVIGMSYYPYWKQKDFTETIDHLTSNMTEVSATYGKPVMICEIGGESARPENNYAMLKAVQQRVQALPNGMGRGVFYWEPEGARSWSRYPLSAWQNNGQPTLAITAFKEDTAK